MMQILVGMAFDQFPLHSICFRTEQHSEKSFSQCIWGVNIKHQMMKHTESSIVLQEVTSGASLGHKKGYLVQTLLKQLKLIDDNTCIMIKLNMCKFLYWKVPKACCKV